MHDHKCLGVLFSQVEGLVTGQSKTLGYFDKFLDSQPECFVRDDETRRWWPGRQLFFHQFYEW